MNKAALSLVRPGGRGWKKALPADSNGQKSPEQHSGAAKL